MTGLLLVFRDRGPAADALAPVRGDVGLDALLVGGGVFGFIVLLFVLVEGFDEVVDVEVAGQEAVVAAGHDAKVVDDVGLGAAVAGFADVHVEQARKRSIVNRPYALDAVEDQRIKATPGITG